MRRHNFRSLPPLLFWGLRFSVRSDGFGTRHARGGCLSAHARSSLPPPAAAGSSAVANGRRSAICARPPCTSFDLWGGPNLAAAYSQAQLCPPPLHFTTVVIVSPAQSSPTPRSTPWSPTFRSPAKTRRSALPIYICPPHLDRSLLPHPRGMYLPQMVLHRLLLETGHSWRRCDIDGRCPSYLHSILSRSAPVRCQPTTRNPHTRNRLAPRVLYPTSTDPCL